jgi:hypothetical protein
MIYSSIKLLLLSSLVAIDDPMDMMHVQRVNPADDVKENPASESVTQRGGT